MYKRSLFLNILLKYIFNVHKQFIIAHSEIRHKNVNALFIVVYVFWHAFWNIYKQKPLKLRNHEKYIINIRNPFLNNNYC